jgi:hypothetical protein
MSSVIGIILGDLSEFSFHSENLSGGYSSQVSIIGTQVKSHSEPSPIRRRFIDKSTPLSHSPLAFFRRVDRGLFVVRQ